MKPLRVSYIGNFRHPWCTEVHIARELRGLGHEVREWQEPHAPERQRAFLHRLERASTVDKPDLVMFTRTWGLPPDTTGLWRRLEGMGIVTCSYHLDLYVGLKREEGIEADPFWTTQHVFTPDGDPKSAEFFANRGINHHWSPPAVVSDECEPGTPREKYDYDVVFVGSEGYHPEWPWRAQLLDFLRDDYGDRFRRFGGDCPEGPTRGKDLNDLYATAKVVVGDSLCLPGHQRYFSDRYFETIGRGGFLIAPVGNGIEDLLPPHDYRGSLGSGFFAPYWYPDPEIPGERSVFEALCAVGEVVESWLGKDDAVRRQIADAGQKFVRENHTYRHRLSAALATMGFEDAGVVGADSRLHRLAGDGAGSAISVAPPAPVGWLPTDSFTAIELPIEKLELGSGYHPTPGFTHLDINPNAPDVDIVGPAWPLSLPDACVGELRAVDVLEHMSYLDTDKILADWFRVLRPGGKLYVQVPDADLIMRWYVDEPRHLLDRLPVNVPSTALAGAAWRLLGGHHDDVQAHEGDDWRWNAHYALFSQESLIVALGRAGFVVDEMRVNIHPNILCWAHKP